MTHIGYVIPADSRTECHTFTWDTEGELLAQLHSEIGAELLDKTSSLPTPDGAVLRLWVADTWLMGPASLPMNERATAVAFAFGYSFALAGIVVATGGPDPMGDFVGLSDDQLRFLRSTMRDLVSIEQGIDYALIRRERMSRIAEQMADAIKAHDREGVAAALKALEAVSPIALVAGIVSVEQFAPGLMPDEL